MDGYDEYDGYGFEAAIGVYSCKEACPPKKMRILNYTLDFGNRTTPLCVLGRQFHTDKSPLNFEREPSMPGVDPYRHGYTPYYFHKFMSLHDKPILFGEIGVLHNASMKMWRQYFTRARLVGFDFSDEFLDNARSDRLEMASFVKMDIRDPVSIDAALRRGRGLRGQVKYDILVEDSTHNLPDQVRFIKIALGHVRSGGTIVIEDVYRTVPNSAYLSMFDHHTRSQIHTIEFIDTRHAFENSVGWNNSKLIVITRA